MAVKMKACMNHIIVKVLPKNDKTEGGLYVPDSARSEEPQLTCQVVSVGNKVEDDIKEGDLIWCHARGGQDIMTDRVIYKILKDNEIYAVIERI